MAVGILTALLGGCAQGSPTAEPPPSPPPLSEGAPTAGSWEAELPATSPPVDAHSRHPAPTTPAMELEHAGDLRLGECLTTGTLQASLRPANLLFLVDRSASLACNPPPVTDSAACEADPRRADPALPSKWEIVREALLAAIGDLPEGTSAAITYFSNDDLAFAGGAPSSQTCDRASDAPEVGDCHFDMTRAADLAGSLKATLAKISQAALGCEFDLPSPEGIPVDYERVNVVYTDQSGTEQVIGQDTTEACDGGANGWQYNGDRSRVHICGEACQAVRASRSIRIALGCESVVVK